MSIWLGVEPEDQIIGLWHLHCYNLLVQARAIDPENCRSIYLAKALYRVIIELVKEVVQVSAGHTTLSRTDTVPHIPQYNATYKLKSSTGGDSVLL